MCYLIVSQSLPQEDQRITTLICSAANKAIYDTYGEYALKEGIVTPEGSKSLIVNDAKRNLAYLFRRENWRRLLYGNELGHLL